MRDLKADLEICNAVLPIKPKVPSDFRFMEDALFFVEAREGWPEAMERAIKAEAKAERLQAENAKLKEIIKRMRLDVCRLEYGDDFDSCSTQEREGGGSCAYLNNFETAYLAELDEAKEGER